jgi:N-acetylglutamate synthase-like GNAT family acetyltransferase
MTVVSTRLATPADADAALAVLKNSITQLCGVDHQSDGPTLERWLRNKTPEQFDRWVHDPDTRLVVAEFDSTIVGVTALHRSGEIRLCYVRPDLVRSGVGRTLLAALEAHARQWGIRNLTLHSSLTARPFYERYGYVCAGDSTPSFGVLRGYPYAKVLSI